MPVKGLNDPRVTLLHVPITRFEWVVVETAFLTTHPAGGGHAIFAKTRTLVELAHPNKLAFFCTCFFKYFFAISPPKNNKKTATKTARNRTTAQ